MSCSVIKSMKLLLSFLVVCIYYFLLSMGSKSVEGIICVMCNLAMWTVVP